MTQLRAAAVIAFSLIALIFALPASASPPTSSRAEPLFVTGLHAHQVEPLVRGVFAQGVQVMVFAGCFVALDKNDTCVDVATRAKDAIEPAAQMALGTARPTAGEVAKRNAQPALVEPSATLAQR